MRRIEAVANHCKVLFLGDGWQKGYTTFHIRKDLFGDFLSLIISTAVRLCKWPSRTCDDFHSFSENWLKHFASCLMRLLQFKCSMDWFCTTLRHFRIFLRSKSCVWRQSYESSSLRHIVGSDMGSRTHTISCSRFMFGSDACCRNGH